MDYSVLRKTDKLTIPVELSSYVVHQHLVKPFSIYLYLKFHCSGMIRKDSDAFKAMGKVLGMKSKRTVQKHLDRLFKLKWAHHSKDSGLYFVHGIDKIRRQNQWKGRQATTLYYYHLKDLRALLNGVVICSTVNKQKYYWEVAKRRRLKPVAKHSDATYTAKVYADTPTPLYYGIGLKKIAGLLGCRKTRAWQLRKEAAAKRFIKIRHRFRKIATLSKPDYSLRSFLYETNPKLKGRIRFSQIKRKGQLSILVLIQLHDEIIPKINFKSIGRLISLPATRTARVLERSVEAPKAA